MVTVFWTTDNELLQLRPDKRNNRHEIGGDLSRPKAFLIPRKQIAGERKAEYELKQNQTEPKVHFSRSFVSAVDDDLHQMQNEQDGHRLGHVMVKSTEQPSAMHFVLNVINDFPGSLGTG